MHHSVAPCATPRASLPHHTHHTSFMFCSLHTCSRCDISHRPDPAVSPRLCVLLQNDSCAAGHTRSGVQQGRIACAARFDRRKLCSMAPLPQSLTSAGAVQHPGGAVGEQRGGIVRPRRVLRRREPSGHLCNHQRQCGGHHPGGPHPAGHPPLPKPCDWASHPHSGDVRTVELSLPC